MMNVENGQLERLLNVPNDVPSKLMFEELLLKGAVLICNPQDEEKCMTLMKMKDVEPVRIVHETGISLNGKFILITAEKPEEVPMSEIQDAISQFARKELERQEQEYLKHKLETADAPIEELENRAYQRQQHKFALRQSNKFGRRK